MRLGLHLSPIHSPSSVPDFVEQLLTISRCDEATVGDAVSLRLELMLRLLRLVMVLGQPDLR